MAIVLSLNESFRPVRSTSLAVDWAQPVNRGLRRHWPLNGHRTDIVTGVKSAIFTSGAEALYGPCIDGLGFIPINANTTLTPAGDTAAVIFGNSLVEGTIALWLRGARTGATQAGTNEHVFGFSGFTTNCLEMQTFGGNIYAGFYNNAVGGGAGEYRVVVACSDAVWSIEPQEYVLTWRDGVGSTLYRNGRQIGATSGLIVGNPATSLAIGSRDTTSGGNAPGTIGEFRCFNRRLSASEVFAMHQPVRRWASYKQLIVRSYFDVGGGTTLTMPTISSGAALTTPTLAAGAVGITTATLASGAALNAPTLAYVLQPPTLASGALLNAPVVANDGTTNLLAPTIASGAILTAPTLAPGAVAVAPPTIASAAVVRAPTLAYVLAPPTVTSGVLLTAPTVAAGAVGLTAAFISSSATLFAPTVDDGSGPASDTDLGSRSGPIINAAAARGGSSIGRGSGQRSW